MEVRFAFAWAHSLPVVFHAVTVHVEVLGGGQLGDTVVVYFHVSVSLDVTVLVTGVHD